MAEWKLKPESNKKKANVKPAAKMTDIITYWDREDPVYFSLLVRVIKRTGSKVQFAICNPETGEETLKKGRPYTVDLNDYLSVLGDLPSTAPLATKARPYGLVFLTETYLKAHKITPKDGGGGGGGKVPVAASL